MYHFIFTWENKIGSVPLEKRPFLRLHSATSSFKETSKSFNVSNTNNFSFYSLSYRCTFKHCKRCNVIFVFQKKSWDLGCIRNTSISLSRRWILWGVKRIKEKLGHFFMALWKHLNLAIWVPIGGWFYCARYWGESVSVISSWIRWSLNTSLQVFLLPDKNKLGIFILKQTDCGLGGFK